MIPSQITGATSGPSLTNTSILLGNRMLIFILGSECDWCVSYHDALLLTLVLPSTRSVTHNLLPSDLYRKLVDTAAAEQHPRVWQWVKYRGDLQQLKCWNLWVSFCFCGLIILIIDCFALLIVYFIYLWLYKSYESLWNVRSDTKKQEGLRLDVSALTSVHISVT